MLVDLGSVLNASLSVLHTERDSVLWCKFSMQNTDLPSQATKPCLCHSHLNLRDSEKQKNVKKKDAGKDFVISILLVA